MARVTARAPQPGNRNGRAATARPSLNSHNVSTAQIAPGAAAFNDRAAYEAALLGGAGPALWQHVADALAADPEANVPAVLALIEHLRGRACDGTCGGVEVSKAALNAALGYIVYLEAAVALSSTVGAT